MHTLAQVDRDLAEWTDRALEIRTGLWTAATAARYQEAMRRIDQLLDVRWELAGDADHLPK